MSPDPTTIEILERVERDIQAISALAQAARMLGVGLDASVPAEVVFHLGRLIEEAAERVEAALHDANVALAPMGRKAK